VQFGEQPPVDEWVHIAVAFDGQTIRLYLNADEKTTADFSFGVMRDATVMIGSDNLGGANGFFGTIDEVRLYDTALAPEDIEGVMSDTGRNPELAKGPKPKDAMSEAARDTILRWGPGLYADKHNVYFGTSFDDVNLATVDDPRGVLVALEQEEASYDPPGLLDFSRTYYWRVDEVNDAEPNSPWKGNVWSFTVRDYVLIDDFEGYTDTEPNRIFDVWADYVVNGTGMTVGYFDPPYVEMTNIHGGRRAMPLTYDNDGTVNEGTGYQQTGTKLYSQADRVWQTPQNWAQDVDSLSLWFLGYPPYRGDFVELSSDTYTVTGSGADIWKQADEFHFAYKEVASGGCTIIAKVESFDPLNKDSKAGIMVRDSLDPGSVNAALLLTPDPEKGLRFQYRLSANASTTRGDPDLDPNAMAPYWLKIECTAGGLIRAYRSPDGAQWTQFDLKVLTMPRPIYVGLAVTSHDTAQVCQGLFSHVSFGTNDALAAQPWSHADIGITSNQGQPMYVEVNGTPVYHDDPEASLTGQWTQWIIPLRKFADPGVDLANVTSLGIGFGDPDNPQPAWGRVYIDDIRLYVPTPPADPQ
jgi:hypothetical protein